MDQLKLCFLYSAALQLEDYSWLYPLQFLSLLFLLSLQIQASQFNHLLPILSVVTDPSSEAREKVPLPPRKAQLTAL